MKFQNRVFCIARCLPDIIIPVKAAKRVKYRCIEVSNHFICLGASTGSTYIFDRSTATLIKFISNKFSGIIMMKFSCNEKILAVADSYGLLTCWEVDEITHSFKMIKEIEEFSGHTITALCWSEKPTRLFVGDSEGQVMSFSMGFSKPSFSISNVEYIQKNGESIVQMDFCNGKLLISTRTKSLLFNEDRSKFWQIGTKSRDGFYGSCFLRDTGNACPVIYSARPGSRLWEVDFGGQVLSTHQFKELLAVPPTPIICGSEVELPESDLYWSHPQAFNFPFLYPLKSQYLLTWSPHGIYLFEPRIGTVAAWNDQIKDIVGISCYGYDIYVLHNDSSVTEICLMTTKEALFALKKLGEWNLLSEFACSREEEILDDVESFLAIDFHEILGKLKEVSSSSLLQTELILKMEVFITNVEQKHAVVKAQVQEKINEMAALSDCLNDTSYDDGDDICSNFSDGGSGSSRMSLSIMSEISLNSFWKKATNIVASKMIGKGFMKNSWQDALQEEGVYLDLEWNGKRDKNTLFVEEKEFHSAPSSPVSSYSDLKRTTSDRILHLTPSNIETFRQKSEAFSALLPSIEDANIVDNQLASLPVSRSRGNSRRKKKKVKIRKIEPQVNEESDLNDAMKYSLSQGNDLQRSCETDSTKECLDQLHGDSQYTDVSTYQAPDNIMLQTRSKESEEELLRNEENSSNVFSSFEDHVTKLPLCLPSNVSFLINKVVNSTAATRNGIRDPSVLYNPKAIKELLQRWANRLGKVSAQFEEECIAQFPLSYQDNMAAGIEFESRMLMFNQLSAAFGEISNAAMLCFEANLFPKNCSVLKSHEIDLLNLDITIDEINTRMNVYWKTMNVSSSEGGTSKTEEIYSNDDLTSCNENSIINERRKNSQDSLPTKSSLNQGDFIEKSIGTIPNMIYSESDTLLEGPENKITSNLPVDLTSVSTCSSRSETVLSSSDTDFIPQKLNENPWLCENYNRNEDDVCEQCEMDKCRACFVLRYFPLLNFSRMHSLLLWNGGCRWRTWLACMVNLKELHKDSKISQLMENGTIPAIISELKQNNMEVFLGNSSRLYDISPEIVAGYIDSSRLTPWEITLLYQTDFLKNNCVNDFLQYADDHLSSNQMDTLFLLNLLHSALMFQPNRNELFCSCEKARPGSNIIQWKWEKLLKRLIDSVRSNFTISYTKKVIRFSQLCLKAGFWVGYMHFLCIVDEVKTAILLAYQIGDYDLLNDTINQGLLVPTDDLWAYLLETIDSHLDSGDDHTCKPIEGWVRTLTLEKLLKLIAMNSGSRFTLELIHKLANFDKLASDIYLSLVMAAELENKQENLVMRLVEVASGKVWLENKHFLHPEFESIKLGDLNESEPVSVSPTSFVPNNYITAESDTVWGRSINISSAECPVCTLPLCLKTLSSSTAGLIVFQCGHSFHKVCVPESACLVCFHENFLTVCQ